MEIELQGNPQSLRSQHQNRVRAAKADLVKYKKLSGEIQAQIARTDLLSSNRRVGLPSSDEPYTTTSDRQRLLSGTALLEDGSKRLQESQRVALETEEQGADILMNLRRQREQIENSRNMVRKIPTVSIDDMLIVVVALHRRFLHRPCFRNVEKDDQTVRLILIFVFDSQNLSHRWIWLGCTNSASWQQELLLFLFCLLLLLFGKSWVKKTTRRTTYIRRAFSRQGFIIRTTRDFIQLYLRSRFIHNKLVYTPDFDGLQRWIKKDQEIVGVKHPRKH